MSHIFLSYAREDRAAVENLYLKLRQSNLEVWMDKPPPPHVLEGIKPGERWDTVLRQRMRDASHVLVFLSKASVAKRGYVQREYRLALSYAIERPSDVPYLIPVLLDDCKPPDYRIDNLSLDQFDWYRMYESGPEDLVEYLKQIASAQADHDAMNVPGAGKESNENEPAEAAKQRGPAFITDDEPNQADLETESGADPFADEPRSGDPTVIGLRNRVRLLTAELAQRRGESAMFGARLHLLQHQLRECIAKNEAARLESEAA